MSEARGPMLDTCLGLLFIALINSMTNNLNRKVLFILQLTVHSEMKSGQKFKAGAEAGALKEGWVLAYSSWLVQTAFLYHSEPCAQVAPLIVGCTHPHR